MKLKKQNRIKSRQPTKAKFWCGCDRKLVGVSGKCPACGGSYKGIKAKRPGPTE